MPVLVPGEVGLDPTRTLARQNGMPLFLTQKLCMRNTTRLGGLTCALAMAHSRHVLVVNWCSGHRLADCLCKGLDLEQLGVVLPGLMLFLFVYGLSHLGCSVVMFQICERASRDEPVHQGLIYHHGGRE